MRMFRRRPDKVPADSKRWQNSQKAGFWVDHLDGVPWDQAPLPRRTHQCFPQTRGLGISRCPCGAIRQMNGPWAERNSRRTEERKFRRKVGWR